MRPLRPDHFQSTFPQAPPLKELRDDVLRIRHALDVDLPDIHRLDREAFPGAAYPYFALRQFFDVFDDFLLVAEDMEDRILVGYILACPKPDGDSCWLHSLGVTESLRGRGLGRRLVVEVLKLLLAEGFREARLTVHPGNATALRLYESFGFTPDSDAPRPDYYGPGEIRMTMTLRLR
ncbi:GNAT family N-acetyltransferase [Streptomyces sp. NBC_01235]|uniref:GNAT family N-acetyltransferase n=1 Tax=Streptomyces sp. NBC_01235 TaxID=2903788 RepID=UPI002E10D542|nr:GNAT family N-acetyltransferase [Streptomyces sp. NBC_01235]